MLSRRASCGNRCDSIAQRPYTHHSRDLPAREAARSHQEHLGLRRLQLCDHGAHTRALFFGQKVVEGIGCGAAALGFALRSFLASRSARIRAKGVDAKIDGSPVNPARQIFFRAVLRPVLMQPVESVRGELFSLTGVSGKPDQRPDQAWIVFEEEFLEGVVGCNFRPGPQKQSLVSCLHSYSTSRDEET